MKKIKALYLALFALLFSTFSLAAEQSRFTGLVPVSAKQSLYVDHLVAAPGSPTVVLINGLTYSTSSWDSFVNQLKGNGLGILRFDFRGQGKTIIHDGPITDRIEFNQQLVDFRNLLHALKLDNQKLVICGLSYGGGIATAFSAQYPELVKSTILMAPFVAPLTPLDNIIRSQVAEARMLNPFLKLSDDEIYDYYLHLSVYSMFPSAEPVVLSHLYFLEGVFRLTQGIRKFYASTVVKSLPNSAVHLMVAMQDQYVPLQMLEEFWSVLPTEKKASRIYIAGSEHRMPEAIPGYSAAWVKQIIKGNSKISGGQTFYGVPIYGTAYTNSGTNINVFSE